MRDAQALPPPSSSSRARARPRPSALISLEGLQHFLPGGLAAAAVFARDAVEHAFERRGIDRRLGVLGGLRT